MLCSNSTPKRTHGYAPRDTAVAIPANTKRKLSGGRNSADSSQQGKRGIRSRSSTNSRSNSKITAGSGL